MAVTANSPKAVSVSIILSARCLAAQRAQGGRGERRFQAVQEYPDGRPTNGERSRRGLPEAEARQRLTGGPGGRIEARADTIDHRDRHEVRDLAPFLPAVKAAQIVRAHDPDE